MAPADGLPLDGELGAVAARVAGRLLSREKVGSVLELVGWLAGTAIGAATGAGVTLVDDENGPATTSASGTLVRDADTLQYELGEGPSLRKFSTQACWYRVCWP